MLILLPMNVWEHRHAVDAGHIAFLDISKTFIFCLVTEFLDILHTFATSDAQYTSPNRVSADSHFLTCI